MRYLLSIFLAIFSLSTFASHILGGNITWDCVGNNQYVFRLTLYKECAAGTAGLQTSQTIAGPNGNISLPLAYSKDISVPCTGGAAVYCGMTGSGNGAVEQYVYESTPTTLTGTIPPTGWDFSWSDCCRPGNTVNTFSGGYYLSSKMYSSSVACNSSPVFLENVAKGLTASSYDFSVQAQSKSNLDSLYYRFVAPRSSATSAVVFNSGYSATSPFPSNLTNSSNSPIKLDSITGLISLHINVAVAGLYVYGIAVEQWRDNVLLSEVFQDASFIHKGNTPTNAAPSVFVDTSLYNHIAYDGRNYHANVYPGDTLDFEIHSSDMDFNVGANQFQVISFNASGAPLDTSWGGLAPFSSTPQLNPILPQTTYSQQLSNNIRFYWETGNEHITDGRGAHVFQFEFADDQCPFPGRRIVSLIVNVSNVFSISQDTVFLCSSDSIELNGYSKSGNYLWTPANNISSDTVANPIVWPSSSQYYYLTDPTNPGLKDSVYVDVTNGGTYNLVFQSGQLQINGTAQPSQVQWYYNGMPFVYPFDTLTPFGLGSYYILAQDGNCTYNTDTVVITSGTSFATTAPGNGIHSGTIPYNAGSLGTTFQVNQNVNVQWIAIPGLVDLHGKTGTGYDLNVKVYDANENEILSKDVVLTKPFDNVLKVPVSLSLVANANYTVAVTGDTAYGFSVFENVVFPSTPFNVGLTVLSATQGAAKQFPDTASNYLLPLTFGIDKTVSLPEWTNNAVVLYPNPARDEVNIYGIAGAQFLELRDVNGKLCRRTQIAKGQESIVIKRGDLPSGLYFITVQFEKGSSSQKLLLE